jgi:DNA-binding response OmpR family regulator
MMPHLNGRQLYERLRQARSGLRCIYMSGYPADVLDRERGLDFAAPYLQKPFTLGELEEKLRQALAAGAAG